MQNKKEITLLSSSIGEYIYMELKNKIIQLEILPGEAISEQNISKLFNSSRTPVKNAFTKLEIEKLITVKSQVGSFVSKIDKEVIIELATMRMLLEFSIIDEVCKNITAKDFAFLQNNIKKQKELIKKTYTALEKAEKFWELDNEFHNFIFKISQKEYLWTYIQDNSPHINRYRILSCTLTNNYLDKIIQDHETILQNIYDVNQNQKRNYYSELKKLYAKHILSSINNNLDTLQEENPEFFY
ncbi:MAG: GntR family transcriptional regulator [Mycoplasmatales bacterium]